MAKTLVTGATGLIGYNIVRELLSRGRQVKALVRSVEKARRILPPACELAPGDVTKSDSVEAAVDGCDVVYHCAGLPEQWLSRITQFDEVNAGGTRIVGEAALQKKVRRFMYTSTIDIFEAPDGAEYDESKIDAKPKGTAYERSKQEADRVAVSLLGRGLPVTFLHPSGLYGPGPESSPGTNQLFVDLNRGKIPMLLPGGLPLVFSEDCAHGHILAEEKGKVGDRFILSESYMSLVDLAKLVSRELALKKVPPVMPYFLGKTISVAGEIAAKVIQKPPLIPKGQLHFLQWQARPSSARAQKELGWKPIPLEEGVRKTIAFLRADGRL